MRKSANTPEHELADKLSSPASHGARRALRTKLQIMNAAAATHCKAQTTGITIKDEHDGFAIDPARDSVWFRIQHVSFLCQIGAILRRPDVSTARYRTCPHQQYAGHEKAKRMPMSTSRVVLDVASLTKTARATSPASRKRRQHWKRRTSPRPRAET
ncbi:hypothetical protein [Paraburkholderia ultramafica]|uniref:hypothetical protein n=1 Tax=Paraburkholderia ultramafica TaxID=1544867 RepID=UPI001582CFFC|nr:hypothetical protein [Paraburkholderia ultramafica]